MGHDLMRGGERLNLPLKFMYLVNYLNYKKKLVKAPGISNNLQS